MKITFNFLTGLILIFFSTTCNTGDNSDVLEITGTIQEQGMTSYQYGTHTLTNNETFYAIKSDGVDLNNYLNQEVTVKAEKIEGYPIEGGPDYLRVLEVTTSQ